MRVTAVTTKQHYSGIFVPDLDTVKRALYAYSDGVSSASNATRANQPRAVIVGLDMIQTRSNSFIEELHDDISKTLLTQTEFSRHYDYDGPGEFLKTTVEVAKVPKGYIVGFVAAYVGREPEKDIATHLDATRGLYWSKVSITLDAAQGNQFVIDLKPIMDALGQSTFTVPSAEVTASHIAAGDKTEHTSLIHRGGVVSLFEQDGIKVSLQLDDITVGSFYKRPFVADGTVITGPSYEDRYGDSELKQPVIDIRLTHESRDENGILDITVQDAIVELTNTLSALVSDHLVERTIEASA